MLGGAQKGGDGGSSAFTSHSFASYLFFCRHSYRRNDRGLSRRQHSSLRCILRLVKELVTPNWLVSIREAPENDGDSEHNVEIMTPPPQHTQGQESRC